MHPAFTPDELRAIVARASRRAGSRCGTICEALDEENYGAPQGRARAEYATLLLNLEAGFLRGCADGERELRRCEGHFDGGRFDDAHRCGRDVNECRSVRRCDGERDDDRGHDDHDDHDDRDDGHRHEESHGKGKKK